MKLKLGFIFLLTVSLFFIYNNIKNLGFATVDDQWMLLDVEPVRSPIFNWDFFQYIMREVNSLQYAPFNTLYYYLIYQINEYDPFYYHMASLIVHFLNSLLVFYLTDQIWRLFNNDKNSKRMAFIVGIIWAVHPFNVESVVWISASKILLYTFFGLLSFITYISYLKTRRLELKIVSIILFVFSCLSKEQAVLLSLCFGTFFILYDNNRLGYWKFKNLTRQLWPFLIISIIFGIITLYAAIFGEGVHNVFRYPFSQRIVLSFYCIFFYFFKSILPTGLHYHYPFPNQPGESLPIIYYFYPLMISGITWLGIIITKRSRFLKTYIFALSVFIFNLLLSIQVFPLARAAIGADRYMYFSLIGILLLLFTGTNELVNAFRSSKWNKWGGYVLFAFFFVSLSVYSRTLVNKWKNMQISQKTTDIGK